MVGDQSNMLAAKRREFFRFEDVEPCLHPAGAARLFLGGVRRNAKGEEQSDTEQHTKLSIETAAKLGQSIPSGCASPMIFWNASFGAALCA